ncbi:NAD(P)H-binding protein [Bacillus sp. ISL-4]|uniref:NAD(P)H-binding protein n=1 Tax=Bacillus sp. ISL-4 TaxID=2819125 RepID=UPI001BE60EBB|nr:NAD(P)H-binding protein [Bacillus sp. ISL-4]MBT2667230.1 NAD(P)H-binding protein [Bacillus sp. ISL-4]MBT2670561.1 NAD(P)H-binding protein [Streptomyces sp. ISL-14]
MRVLVIGTEDMTGEHVVKQLADRYHNPVALVGSENKVEEMVKLGASDVVSLENRDFPSAFSGCEAIIYLGNASPRTGEGKPILVDHQSVIDSFDAAKKHGVKRFILMSGMRANEMESRDACTIGVKYHSEELLRQEKFTYTVIRTSMPVDKPGIGKVEAGSSLVHDKGEIPKEDIASVLVEALDTKEVFNKTFNVTSGEILIHEALKRL